MSFEAVAWASKQRGLKPTTWRVLMNLADRHNPDHGCFPNQACIAADCEISRRSVNYQLELLVALGLIQRVRRIDPKTRKQMSTRYILGFEQDFTQEPCARKEPDAAEESENPCAISDKSRVQKLHTNLVIESTTTDLAVADRGIVDQCIAACGPGLSPDSRRVIRDTDGVIRDWLDGGADLDADILPVLRERTETPKARTIRTWAYFSQAVLTRQVRRVAQAERLRKAAEKQPVAAVALESDKVSWLADRINKGFYVSPAIVSNRDRDALLARELVTPEQLRRLSIY
jgi:hypothetical protein